MDWSLANGHGIDIIATWWALFHYLDNKIFEEGIISCLWWFIGGTSYFHSRREISLIYFSNLILTDIGIYRYVDGPSPYRVQRASNIRLKMPHYSSDWDLRLLYTMTVKFWEIVRGGLILHQLLVSAGHIYAASKLISHTYHAWPTAQPPPIKNVPQIPSCHAKYILSFKKNLSCTVKAQPILKSICLR